MTDFADDEITEILEFDPTRLDAVGSPANGTGWLLLKSTAAPSKVGRQGKRPKSKKGRTKKRGRVALPAMAAKAASSSGSPAMGAGESDAILRWVTGESGATCGMPTADGSPCQRPSVGGLPCHHHI